MLFIGQAQAGQPHEFVLDGRARIPEGERSAQQGYADHPIKIEDGFAIDAAGAERLRDTAAGCLASKRVTSGWDLSENSALARAAASSTRGADC